MGTCDGCGKECSESTLKYVQKEIATGRSGGSFTFGGSESRGSRAGKPNNRHTKSAYFNTGKTYYKIVHRYYCPDCIKSGEEIPILITGIGIVIALVSWIAYGWGVAVLVFVVAGLIANIVDENK